MKKLITIVSLIALALACNVSEVYASNNLIDEKAKIDIPVIKPYNMDITSGNFSGTQFQDSYSLRSKNGKYVNFWIKNNGNSNVCITINGKEERTILPGDNGHIYVEVSYFSSTYNFKAVSGTNGGRINIEYSIAQRDYQ